MVKAHVRFAFSVYGVTGLEIHDTKKVIMINPKHCSKVIGITDNVESFLANNLRMFTPVEYTPFVGTISIKFPYEKIEIQAELIKQVPELVAEEGYKSI